MCPPKHQEKLAQCRKERAKNEACNPSEKREMVIQGATLKCPYTPTPGKLVVTSNQIKLQDQLFATEGDKNNMVNLQFSGVCGHPNFAGQTPPPCMSVINLTPWQNVGTNYIQEQKNLVKESYINCNPVPNVAAPQPINQAARLSAQGSNGDITVVNAYWCDNKTGKNPTSNLLFKKDDDKAYIFIEFSNTTPTKSFTLTIYESDLGLFNDEKIETKQFTIEEKNTTISFDITGALFDKGMDSDEENILNRIDLYFKIKIEGGKEKEYCNTAENRLKVHLIRYIPKIMGNKGWVKGQALQEIWFGRMGTDLRNDYADIGNVITMGWVLGYSRAKAVYDLMEKEKIWVNEAGKKALIKEINKMKLDLPKQVGQKILFGDFSLTETRNEKEEKAPKVDLNHYQERVFEESTSVSTDELDDLFAALANFVFRMAARGTIEKNTEATYKITITAIGVYIRDSFDFIDDSIWYSQPLGNWSAKEMDVNANKVFYGATYYRVNNSNYRSYSKDTGKGGDFLVYSDVKVTTVDDSFTVLINQLTSK